jgi:hypothetical protein
MKMVEFTRDMRPYRAGDVKALPDEAAEQLIKAGEATARPSVFDSIAPGAAASAAGARPQPGDRQRYLTRKGK